MPLNILQWNARSIRSNKGDLERFMFINKIQIGLVCETWLKRDSQFSFPHYNIIRRDRADGYGGVAVLVSSSLPFQVLNPVVTSPSIECVGVSVTINKNLKYNYYSLYKPPQGEVNPVDWQIFFQALKRPFVLCGDFNAHHTSWGGSSIDRQGLKLLQAIEDENLIIVNDGSPTRMTAPNISASAIDLCIVSDTLAPLIDWQVSDDLLGSDHFAIVISLTTSGKSSDNTKQQTTPTYRWNLKEANWAAYQSHMELVANESMSKADFSYDRFIANIGEACEKSIPKVRPTNGLGKFKKHWWSKKCQIAVENRKQKMQDYKSNPTLCNFLQYKSAAAVVKRTIIDSKRTSWRNFCTNLNKNTPTKQVWNEIKKLKRSETELKQRVSTGDWSHEFLDSLTPAFVAPDITTIVTNQNDNQSQSNYLIDPINTREIELALKSNNNSAPGLDQIHYSMLFYLPTNAKEVLKVIYNNILQNSSPPEQWCKFKIVPILKPNKNQQLASSYRPISLASCVLKTFERIIKNRLTWWLSENNHWPKSQYGFRKYHSTNDALLELTLDIQQAFSEKKSVVALFLDIKGAYDSVQLELLVKKLNQIGIPKLITNLIYKLYNNRELYLYTSEEVLGPQTARVGLPQGTILSALNYVLFTHDLEKILPNNVKIIQYADDVCIYVSDNSTKNCLQALDRSLIKISQWMTANGLEISYSKTSVTTFTRSRMEFPPFVILNNTRIAHNTSTKFLGVYIDTKLSWKDHVGEVIRKSEKAINILRMISSLRWGADPIVSLTFYRATIRSIIDYGSLAYGSACNTLLNKLDVLHNKSLRLCIGLLRDTPINTLLSEAGELPLKLRRKK